MIFTNKMSSITIKEFYQDILGDTCPDIHQFLNENIHKDIGHFNVFVIFLKSTEIANRRPKCPTTEETYYKISLIKGKNKVEYANKTIQIEDCAILFASPKIPYNYTNLCTEPSWAFLCFNKKISYLPQKLK